MSIKSGQVTGLLALSSGADTTVANPGSSETYEFYNLVAHETSGSGGGDVELFLSDDAASAAGERIDKVTLAAGETAVMQSVGVPAGKYLIAKAGAADITLHGEYILRNGADI